MSVCLPCHLCLSVCLPCQSVDSCDVTCVCQSVCPVTCVCQSVCPVSLWTAEMSPVFVSLSALSVCGQLRCHLCLSVCLPCQSVDSCDVTCVCQSVCPVSLWTAVMSPVFVSLSARSHLGLMAGRYSHSGRGGGCGWPRASPDSRCENINCCDPHRTRIGVVTVSQITSGHRTLDGGETAPRTRPKPYGGSKCLWAEWLLGETVVTGWCLVE